MAPDVIGVSVSGDRDHPLARVYEAAGYPGQRNNPGTRVHDQISVRSADVIEVRANQRGKHSGVPCGGTDLDEHSAPCLCTG
jgi:hypothetical protein